MVVGPEEVPLVTDAGQARRAPELAVLSAMAHGRRPQREQVLGALLSALSAIDEDRATLCADVVLSVLPEAARRHLEALMRSLTYEYQSEFAPGYFPQGEAKALLEILDVRGIHVPEDVRARLAGCSDIQQLTAWVRRAVTADSIDEVFA